MSVEPQYEQLHRQAEDLMYRLRDSADNRDSSAFQQLDRLAVQLREDMEINRNPRDIEERIKGIQGVLDSARHNDGSFMKISEAERYYRIYEDMRMDLRKLPNY
jgi:hypothetical protein